MTASAPSGKDRRDKYYHLAREIGFRSRASFKLIQLNRKYGFLDNAKVCLDLCAAPGGWMQVAQRTMKSQPIIVGVDQDPIKSIENCISLQEDLMSDRCLKSIQKSLKSWKTDVVLCDGAPHYGVNIKEESVNQNKLVIRSLEIATKTLQKDGWFVTKIARTKHFDALISSMAQLFKKVYVTKPEASRSDSSESYAVCRGYLAPKRVEKSLISVDTVLKEHTLVSVLKSINDIFKMNQKKLVQNLAHIPTKSAVSQFLKSDNYLDILGGSYQIYFDDETVENHDLTTKAMPQIKEYFKDLKILDRRSLKEIIRWRKEINASMNPSKSQTKSSSLAPAHSDQQSVGEHDNINDAKQKIDAERKQARREEKRARKRQQKLQPYTRVEAENDDEVIFRADDFSKILGGENVEFFDMDDGESNIPDVTLNQSLKSNSKTSSSSNTNKWLNDLMIRNKIENNIAEDIESESPQPKRAKKSKNKQSDKSNDTSKTNPATNELNAEELALATAMVSSKKKQRDIDENSVNRYISFDDPDNLPDWFVEDERIARGPVSRPDISDKDIDAQQSKLMKQSRINSKSLSKLAEVRARKKRKLNAKLSKINQSAQNIIDDEFAPTNIKIKKMRDLYRNALQRKERKYIVAKKKHGGKLPKNTKGAFKLVDRRMKKDMRVSKAKKK